MAKYSTRLLKSYTFLSADSYSMSFEKKLGKGQAELTTVAI